MTTPPPGIPTSTNGTHRTGENEKKNRLQVPTTVFVGSITDRAPDIMIKRMLQVSDIIHLPDFFIQFFYSIVVVLSIGNVFKVPMENFKVK